jgi:pimeloyl-ACP methyl ester carboxylesterase
VDKVIFTGAAGIRPKRSISYYAKKYTAKTLKAPFRLLPVSLEEKGLNRLRQTSVWKKLGSSDYQQLSGTMRETFVKTVTEYLESDVKKITHEVLLIWGKNDEATPVYQGEKMDDLLKNSALVLIENAGHYAFLDQKSRFLAILRSYLES